MEGTNPLCGFCSILQSAMLPGTACALTFGVCSRCWQQYCTLRIVLRCTGVQHRAWVTSSCCYKDHACSLCVHCAWRSSQKRRHLRHTNMPLLSFKMPAWCLQHLHAKAVVGGQLEVTYIETPQVTASTPAMHMLSHKPHLITSTTAIKFKHDPS